MTTKFPKLIAGDIITTIINFCVATGHYPHELKQAKVTPIAKKGGKNEVSSYRLICILPILSRIHKPLTLTEREACSHLLQDNLLRT